MVQKLQIAGRMIFKWRRKGSARFIRRKLFRRKMTMVRLPMMIITMWINHIGRGRNNEQGNGEQTNIGQILFWFKESWQQNKKMDIEKNDHEHMTDKVAHLDWILKGLEDSLIEGRK